MERRSLVLVAVLFGGLFVTLFGFLLLAYVAVRASSSEGPSFGGKAVGVLEIKGVIQSADESLKHLRKFADENDVKAVLVRIESPGGAVAPSQELNSELRRLGDKKPVVCSLGDVAASGGYYIAVGCQRIVASPGTLTGSIGVVSQLPYLGGVAEAIKSGELKDVGNPFREMTEAERAYLKGLMDSIHEQFIAAVAKGRGLKVEEVRPWADGRVLTGAQAKELKLIDELGSFNDAARLAGSLGGIEGEPKLSYPREEHGFPFEALFERSGGALTRGVSRELRAVAGQQPIPGPAFLAPQLVGR